MRYRALMATHTLTRRLTALAVYSVAMAFVESAVVVYLRALYPTAQWTATAAVPFTPLVYRTEMLREAATILMLLAVAYIAFEPPLLRVATFFWTFAIWDVFYYVFLRVLVGWPATLTTPDVFFLIPVPWIGPVWFPIACSAAVSAASSWVFWRYPAPKPSQQPSS